MAGPIAAAAAAAGAPKPRRRQPPQQPQQRPGGLKGPELQLVEERLLELQFELLSLHEQEPEEEQEEQAAAASTSTDAGAGAGAVAGGLMAECAAWFAPEHFAAVAEELASLGQCGYPPCRRALGADRLALRPGQKRVDARQRRVVEVTRETTTFCSDPCEAAARRFVARLSTEAPLFRPAARAYVQGRLAEAAEAAGAGAAAKPLALSKGPAGVAAGVAVKGPSLVYELVKRVHGGSSFKAKGDDDPAPPQQQEEAAAASKGQQERPPIRPKLRARGDRPPPAPAPVPTMTKAAADKGKGKGESKASDKGKGKAAAAGAKAGGGGGGGPLRMEVVERAAPDAPQPLSVWVAQGSEVIEGHVVGVLARPSHQPVAELLAQVNDNSDDNAGERAVEALEGLEEDDEAEEGVEEEEPAPAAAAAAAAAAPGDAITTEDELGWAPSTEIDLAALPSVVDTDFFMQVWTTVSEWLTPEAREFVRRVLPPGGGGRHAEEQEEDEGAVLAALLARPEPQARRKLLDAQKRQRALEHVLAPHLPAAADALRPALSSSRHQQLGTTAARVTARVQALLSTLDLGRALPAFLSTKHYEALALLFTDAAVAGGAGGAALLQSSSSSSQQQQPASPPPPDELLGLLARVGLSPAEYRSLLGDFELPE